MLLTVFAMQGSIPACSSLLIAFSSLLVHRCPRIGQVEAGTMSVLVDQLLDLEDTGLPDEDAVLAIAGVKEPMKDEKVLRLCEVLLARIQAIEDPDAMQVTGPEVST